MEVQIAVAKVNKYATSESGDTLEVVERPNGGLSVVLADGQTSGRGAKAVLADGRPQGDRSAGGGRPRRGLGARCARMRSSRTKRAR
ncbi:MAG: hypothetical protein M0C28_34470 [Candidatus Moduliflexus flocculans]|nr:hypothetical protein [Candidatus Moduliflexus flocculans]